MTKPFDFESYTVNQLDRITKQLDNLNTTFVPREEIMLMRAETTKTLAVLTETLAKHTTILGQLQNVDARQQGSIDTSRRMTSYGLTIMGIVVALIIGYLQLHHKV